MMIYKKLFLTTFLGVFVMSSPVSAAPIEDDDSFDSPEEKFAIYKTLATIGSANAQFNIGAMYSKGEDVAKNHAEAFQWSYKAAENGNSGAQFIIGKMYSKGQGVDQDDEKAFQWWQKAAEQGDAIAQLLIKARDAKGEGVNK